MIPGKRKQLPHILTTIVISCLFFMVACDRTKPSPISRAYDRYLYPADVEAVVRPGLNEKDSLNLINAYIEQWQRQQVLLKQAQRHVNVDEKRINAQIEEYKNALIIYEYEQMLLKNKLDTIVSNDEIADYYNEHQNIFVLKRPIFKVSFIQLTPDTPELDRVEKWFLSEEIADFDLLQQYCERYSPNFALRDTSWYYLEELAKKIPIEQIDENNYKNYGRIFKINENNKLYLIILRDSKLKNNRSPLEVERTNIRNLIVNQRKVSLINNVENKMVEEARKHNKIETYSK